MADEAAASRHRRLRDARRWLVKALLERGARVVVLKRDRGQRLGAAARGHRGALLTSCTATSIDAGADGPRDRRVRGRHRLPPRRADDRRDRQPLAGLDLRVQHPRDLDAAGGVPLATAWRGPSSPPPTRPTAVTTRCPTRRSFALQPTFPYDVSKACDRPDRAVLLAHVRAAGRRHALREHLRRRRPQPLAPRARGWWPRCWPGRAPVIRSDGSPRARLPLRRGRRCRLPRDRRCAATAKARAARRSTPAASAAQRARGRRARCSRSPAADVERRRTRARACRRGEIDRQYVDSTKLRELTGWAPAVDLEKACGGRSSGTARTRSLSVWHRGWTTPPAISVVVALARPPAAAALAAQRAGGADARRATARSSSPTTRADSETDDAAARPPARAAPACCAHLAFAAGPGPGRASATRAGARPARRGRLFTDDDCRPPRDWLANACPPPHARARRDRPGRDRGRPRRGRGQLRAAARAHARRSSRRRRGARPATSLYPRESCWRRRTASTSRSRLPAGEDTDLVLRAQALGARYEAAPEILTHHCVEPATLLSRVREVQRWEHLPFVVRAHPEVRDELPGFGMCWKPAHARLPLAAAGLLTAALAVRGRRPDRLAAGLTAALPWAWATAPRYGSSPRGVARAVSELPGRLVLDVAEVTALVRGSVRYRTLLL